MWVKVDDRYHQNMKTTYIGQAAADLHIAALEYCNTHLTDGFIPAADVPKLRRYRYRARVPRRFTWLTRCCAWLLRETLNDSIVALTTSYEGKRPMWQRVEAEGVPGYRIHDFHNYQPKRKNVLANQRRTSERRNGGADARTTAPASVQPTELYVQPDLAYVQPPSASAHEEGGVHATDGGVPADSHKDDRARVPGTDPDPDPGTIPDVPDCDQSLHLGYVEDCATLKTSAAPPEAAVPVLEFPTVGPGGHLWPLTIEQLTEWQATFPHLDVNAEMQMALAWLRANRRRLKTRSGMPDFLVRWLIRSVNGATSRGYSTTADASPPDAGAITALNLQSALRRRGIAHDIH